MPWKHALGRRHEMLYEMLYEMLHAMCLGKLTACGSGTCGRSVRAMRPRALAR